MNAAVQKFNPTTPFPPGPFAWEVRHTAEGKKAAELLVTRAPMPFNDPVIFALREDWMGRLSPEREAVKQAITALPILIEALIELTPYLEKMSQPGERWPALCARQALQAAGILPPPESQRPNLQASTTSPADKLYAALALILNVDGDQPTMEEGPAKTAKDLEFIRDVAVYAYETADPMLESMEYPSIVYRQNAILAMSGVLRIVDLVETILEGNFCYGSADEVLVKIQKAANDVVEKLQTADPLQNEPTFPVLYALKKA